MRIIDKKISKLKKERKNLFFTNIKNEDLEGKIELPLVGPKHSDDGTEYEIIRFAKNNLEEEKIKKLRALEIMQYTHSYIVSEYIKDGVSKEQAIVKANIDVSRLKKQYAEQIIDLDNRINMIEENSKIYLRYIECENRDYSKVESDDVKNKLSEYDKEIDSLCKVRNKMLEDIKQLTGEEPILESNKNLLYRLGFVKKPNKN